MDIIAAFLISVLAGMGVGGGGLLVLYLVFVKEMGQLEAQGINLVFFVFAALSALVYHTRKRQIDWRLVMILTVTGAIGVLGGSSLARALSPEVVRKIFGWLLMVCGATVLVGKRKNKKFEKKG